MNKNTIYGIMIGFALVTMGMGLFFGGIWQVLSGFWLMMYSIERLDKSQS